MKTNHFVTGATGFVGGAIVLELLKKTDDDIFCLVRGENIEQCNLRLKSNLSLWSLAIDEGLEQEIDSRCHAIKGDLDSILFPESIERGDTKITYVWHCAASLKYAEKDKKHINSINVLGTQYICEIANKLKVERFNYISTAYVSGKLEGVIEEEVFPLDNPTSNYYETSKIFAEHYLVENCKSTLKILRPSIVIGHSKTHVPASFSGMYGFISQVNIFSKKVEKKLGSILYHRPLKILSEPKDPINLIPIDYVADAAVRIGLSDSSKLVFHLTNDSPVAVYVPMEVIFSRLKLQKPLYVTQKKSFTDIDRKLDENLDFYSSYLQGVKLFKRDNALSINGVYSQGYYMDKAISHDHVNWYINYIEAGGVKNRLEKKFYEKLNINSLA